MANIIRKPWNAVDKGDHPSCDTANADLSAANWTASADATTPTDTWCPRAFVPKVDGNIAIRGMNDAADTLMYVKQGVVYPIAIKQITRASCDVALQIANAVALLY